MQFPQCHSLIHVTKRPGALKFPLDRDQIGEVAVRSPNHRYSGPAIIRKISVLWISIQGFVSLRTGDHSHTLRCHHRATHSTRSDSHPLPRHYNSSSHSSIKLVYLRGRRTEAIRTTLIDLISNPTTFPRQISTLTMIQPLPPRSKVTTGSASQSVHALVKHVGDSKFAASRIR